MTFIDKKEFLRSFAIRPDGAFNFLLGAGASVQANIPAAGTLIWQFKRKLYCDTLNFKEEKFKDLESDRNQQILQSYFELKGGYPKLWSGEEYSFYFEKCYPKSIDRKAFIQRIIQNKNPSIGHKCLGVLFDVGKTSHIWTTNFDELIENGIKGVNNIAHFEVISPDNNHQIANLNKYPRVLKLHGDYRYDQLQNTTEELRSLENSLHHYFAHSHLSSGLIVIGYSGNDYSVLTAFEETLNQNNPFPYGLYWCVRKGTKPNENLVRLIERANEKSKEKLSGFIEIESFDEFLFDLYVANQKPNADIENIAKSRFETRRPFASPQVSNNFTPIKLNGLKAQVFPKSVLAFKSNLDGWAELRQILDGQPVVGALSKGNTLLFGDINDVNHLFNGRITSEILTLDIDDHITYHENSFFLGMLYDMIDYDLSQRFGLKIDSHHRRKYYSENHRLESAELNSYKTSAVVPVYEAVEIQLEFHNKELFLTLLPSIFIDDQGSLTKIKKQAIANAVFSNRRNSAVNDREKLWISILRGDQDHIKFELAGYKLEFETNYASAGIPVSKTHTFKGAFLTVEPCLNFSLSDRNQRSSHPLRGLLRFGPLDHSYENGKINPQAIKLAIISPISGLRKVQSHLAGLNQEIARKSERDYLIDYVPFASIYKRYLDIPENVENKLLEVINDQEVSQMVPLQFYDFLKRKIDYFYTIRGEFDVLVIYIPSAWSHFRELKNDNVYFDLHDSIKLYCAKKNIKVQFIEDKSINYFDLAKVRWWLSLGLYVKANGTPWRNETISDSTAFIGLDFSVNRINNATRFVLGSSHIFDSSGQGLRFLLQPIENPVFYGRNPFMSKEDARRLILKLKEAYFRLDGNSKLEKLVIHKVLHYTNDEMQGIAEALEGIENIELLQIQKYSNWRAIRGFKDAKSKISIAAYPVQRGTVIQLDDFSFLLWTHGSVLDQDVAGVNKDYYQSTRGIPAPLLIRRFRGTDPIETTVKEVLALTKMNWNGGELYKILPVTLDFSKRLARYAKQAETLQATPYDFRFFM
ncbi:SIR2 family protein [Dyadobacter chenhuakuii]|uniref:SIR2 family protein n=1 Tax=Dyadobacter chenhuakuii TaxID=2909339 RepID=A0ABY4XGA9_9BACT|nr:SIR2 family protein [Dyadobacter chenhuakuii]MCF2495397.1 SIR2 family protein [Dyadobacter chenhuakuii]USJ29435.1 SIR2 family protein [Dyadobacter chenhuakuii]